MKRRPSAIHVLLVLGLASGCEVAGVGQLTTNECDKMQDRLSQDACLFDIVGQAAENNDLETCLNELGRIQDPLLRAAATRMLISRKPQGMEILTATNLCQRLPDNESADCERSWIRPHLWSSR